MNGNIKQSWGGRENNILVMGLCFLFTLTASIYFFVFAENFIAFLMAGFLALFFMIATLLTTIYTGASTLNTKLSDVKSISTIPEKKPQKSWGYYQIRILIVTTLSSFIATYILNGSLFQGVKSAMIIFIILEIILIIFASLAMLPFYFMNRKQ